MEVKKVRLVWLSLAISTTIICVFVWLLVLFLSASKLTLKFYDVGQGDSIFVRTPAGYKLLIDGGPNDRVVQYLDRELPVWDRKIDVVVLTHPQADHLYGLLEVVRRFKIGKILVSGVSNDTVLYKLWLKTLKENNLATDIVTDSSIINLSDTVKLDIVWPPVLYPKVADLNEASVVVKISYGEFDALLTGDADQKVQPYTGSLANTEVLKVPHHGSKTAVSDSFIQQVHPNVAVISVGAKNNYGHPTDVLLQQLKSVNSKIYRTDQNGTFEIVSDGEKWYTVTER